MSKFDREMSLIYLGLADKLLSSGDMWQPAGTSVYRPSACPIHGVAVTSFALGPFVLARRYTEVLCVPES